MAVFPWSVRIMSADRRVASGRSRTAGRLAIYGVALATGTFVLQWLDYRRLALGHMDEIYLALVGGGFLVVGVLVGARALGRQPSPVPDGNPRAVAALGISARELAVLHALAGGGSTREIAAQLGISPNTVKTHVARLFEKLEASRRTDAVARARMLGILP